MALQYPLPFPYGEDSYHEHISYHTNKGKRKTTRDYVTIKEYYAYVIQHRKDQWTTLHRGGWLFQQYLVDEFTTIKEQRLSWTRNNQDTLRVDLYHNVVDAITRGDTNAACLAELPSLATDQIGYKAVSGYMLHGPCGKDNRAAACNIEGKCSKHFPKPFYAETIIDQDGYPIYRQRDDKVFVKKGNFTFDNKHVVPHNRYLLLKYQAHINVEWCNRSKAIKYLFKYLNKGPDRATIVIQENVQQGQGMTEQKVTMNQQPVTLHDTDCLPALLQKEGIDVIMFTDWFELNERHPPARTLTYAQILEHYVWHEQEKKWRPRKQRKCIGRIVYSTSSAGERYFLQMILNVVRGPQKFKHLLMVNDIICSTFKEACFAYGLLNDDKEWTRAIQEASFWSLKLWEENWEVLSDVILYKKRLLFKYHELQLTKEQIQNYCLMEIQDPVVRERAESVQECLTEFSDMPQPNPALLTSLNPEQRLIYEELVDSVHNKKGQFHFVYGPGGTEKMFLYKTIISRLRSELKIILAVASSGIASLLLPGGRTAHNMFVIPLELLENSTCGIKQNTHLVELMQQVELIIWDEAPMT
ncbi:ATP-dependent DNA helicase PIF1-like protein [Tanacetum coccineum]